MISMDYLKRSFLVRLVRLQASCRLVLHKMVCAAGCFHALPARKNFVEGSDHRRLRWTSSLWCHRRSLGLEGDNTPNHGNGTGLPPTRLPWGTLMGTLMGTLLGTLMGLGPWHCSASKALSYWAWYQRLHQLLHKPPGINLEGDPKMAQCRPSAKHCGTNILETMEKSNKWKAEVLMAVPLVLQQIFESRKDLGVFLVNESLQNLELGSLSDLHAMCSDAMTCNKYHKLRKLQCAAMHVFFLLRISSDFQIGKSVCSSSKVWGRSTGAGRWHWHCH